MHEPTLRGLIVSFAVLALVFGLIERRFAAVAGVSIWRRDRRTDFLYWLFTPLVTRAVSGAALIGAVLLCARALGYHGPAARFADFLAARSPLSRQPRGLQLFEALVIADLCGYFTHRAFHRGRLWRFHAIHHSSRMLDWLAATRLHPINDVASKLAVALPLFLLGFDLKVFASVVPLLVFWSIFLHANVPWGLGPLRYLIATPLFHRWHHTALAEGRDKNFAGLFPAIDWVFGTLHLPEGRQPKEFGVTESMPEGLLGQLAYPFGLRPEARTD